MNRLVAFNILLAEDFRWCLVLWEKEIQFLADFVLRYGS